MFAKARENVQATVSHEMRTPLNCIIDMTKRTIESGSATNLDHKILKRIQFSSKICLNFVNDLLDM